MSEGKKKPAAAAAAAEENPLDYWKLHPFTREDNPTGMVEES